jgi:hypothetical protein
VTPAALRPVFSPTGDLDAERCMIAVTCRHGWPHLALARWGGKPWLCSCGCTVTVPVPTVEDWQALRRLPRPRAYEYVSSGFKSLQTSPRAPDQATPAARDSGQGKAVATAMVRA